MELLTNIDRINDFFRIPAIGQAVLYRSQITREVESCSIFFLEDTGWKLALFWKYHTNASIFICGGDSFFYEFLHDIFHRVFEIWIVFIERAGKSKSFIEALSDIISRTDI